MKRVSLQNAIDTLKRGMDKEVADKNQKVEKFEKNITILRNLLRSIQEERGGIGFFERFEG